MALHDSMQSRNEHLPSSGDCIFNRNGSQPQTDVVSRRDTKEVVDGLNCGV